MLGALTGGEITVAIIGALASGGVLTALVRIPSDRAQRLMSEARDIATIGKEVLDSVYQELTRVQAELKAVRAQLRNLEQDLEVAAADKERLQNRVRYLEEQVRLTQEKMRHGQTD